MSGAVTALRRAVRARLAADAALSALTAGPKIFDETPRAVEPPYITFGDAQARDLSSTSYPGAEQVLVLQVWSAQGGAREALDIADRVTFLLDDAALTLAGHRLINLRLTAIEITREAEGRFFRAALRLRAVTEAV